MKYGKVTIAITLVAIMGLGLFVGLVSAPGIPDQFQQILTALLGIQSDVEKTTQMLGSYDGYFVSEVVGDGVIENARITSDKPAIFKVTVSVTGYVDAGDVVWLAQSVNPEAWSTNVGQPIRWPDDNCMTWTVAGYGVVLTYRDFTDANMEIRFCIIVQGEADTVLNPTP